MADSNAQGRDNFANIVCSLTAPVLFLVLLTPLALFPAIQNPGAAVGPHIKFSPFTIPFHLENGETPARNAPETMAGGVAIFDYNGDGRPDIFFTNGANIATLKKDSPKYRNRLFRNDGNGVFTDVTDAAGLAGTGYDMGVAVADYDNDGYPGHVCRRRTPQHALPQQRRRHVHRRHRKGWPRCQPEPSRPQVSGRCGRSPPRGST